jgi:hypothetical protein
MPPLAAAAAAIAAAATPPAWIPYLSLAAGTYCALLAALMALAPGAGLTRALALTGGGRGGGGGGGAQHREGGQGGDGDGGDGGWAGMAAALLPPATAYIILLAASWRPDTFSVLLPGSLAAGLGGRWRPQFFPRLAGVAALFSRPATAASLAVHLAAVGLLAARQAYMCGLQQRRRQGAGNDGGGGGGGGSAVISAVVSAVVVLLLAFFGPLGLAVEAVVDALRGRAREQGRME